MKEIRSHRSNHLQKNTRDGKENVRYRRFIENLETTIKENAKLEKILTQNIQEIQDTMRRPNLRITGID
jgi:flagellar biosynthesis chaperone FliJ